MFKTSIIALLLLIFTIPIFADSASDINYIYANILNNKNTNIANRIAAVSEFFLGKPYQNSPLGEGVNAKFDKNPLYRTDKFDCMTFVSTILAFAVSNNLAEFKINIKKINYYDSKVAFLYRKHFTNADWNATNIAQGYLQDITRNVKDKTGKPIAVLSETIIDKPNWFNKLPATRIKYFQPLAINESKKLLSELHALGKKATVVKSIMHYLPLSKLFTTDGKPKQYLFAQIPSGAIIEIVRPNWDLTASIGTHLDVSHMGFAIRTKSGLMFREASSREGKVIDIPLTTYLVNYLNSPTVKGVNVQIPF
jgi:hypothetical protein